MANKAAPAAAVAPPKGRAGNRSIDELSDEVVVVAAPRSARGGGGNVGFLPPKSKQEESQDDSLDRPPRSLQDLREMQDDFASDSDAPRRPGGAVREVVRAEQVFGGGLEEDGERSLSSSADPFADDERVAGVFSADKLRFVSLPEPLVVPGSKRAEQLEDVIDVLDQADPMLRIAQSKIRGLRNYLHVVEREEVVLLRVRELVHTCVCVLLTRSTKGLSGGDWCDGRVGPRGHSRAGGQPHRV